MTIEAEIAKAVSYRFECKKDGLRQVQEGGVKVTLNINPLDMPQELYGDQMGQRYMCVMVPLNDDETPKQKPKSYAQQAVMLAQDNAFQMYVSRFVNGEVCPDAYIKKFCGVDSKSELIEGTEAGRKFKQLQAQFLEWKDR